GTVNASGGSGQGGSVYVSSGGAIQTGDLTAASAGGNGGSVIVTTAQSGATTSASVSVGNVNVSGATGGQLSLSCSCGASITNGSLSGAAVQTVDASHGGVVLPASVTSGTIPAGLTPDQLPGGGFTSFDNSGGTLTTSGFNVGLIPIVSSGNANVGTAT